MKRQLKRQFDEDKENQYEFSKYEDRFLWDSLGESTSKSMVIRSKNKTIELDEQYQQPKKRRTQPLLSNITNAMSQSNPNNVSRRNERERNRVKLLNMGFDRLRAVVPCRSGEQLSKISTLKKAIWYIEHLDKVLHGQDWPDTSTTSAPNPPSSPKAFQTGFEQENNSGQLAGIAGSKGDQVGTGNPWPISTNMSNSTTCGKRSDNDGPPSSPIFPTYWDQQTIELTSTPKFTDTRRLAPVDLQSTTTTKPVGEIHQRTLDSGYNTSGTPQSLFDPSSRLWISGSTSTQHTPSFPSSSSSTRSESVLTSPTVPSFDWTQSVPQLQWFLRNSMFKTNT